MIWNQIANLPDVQTLPSQGYGQMLLLPVPDHTSNWLVGRYRDLTRLATALRDNASLRELLTKHRVRLGLRDSDVPPAGVERQPRYGKTVAGPNAQTDFTASRKQALATPVKAEAAAPPNRRTDREQNVADFWNTQTPQSHHIVEFNNLETLGASQKTGVKEMDYQQLPAVLLAAEFHQRYISAILRPAQRWTKGRLTSDIVGVYRGIYVTRSTLFKPLWDVSRIILQEAGLPVT
jgi:hypothetical protein